MNEKFSRQPEEPREKLLNRVYDLSLTSFIKSLYPEISKTLVPRIITSLVNGLEPVCRADPFNEDFSEAFAIVRGSSIKRYLFDDMQRPPAGFWEVSEHFQKLVYPNLLVAHDDELTHKIVENLAKGPRDLDIKYHLRDGFSDQDIFTLLNDNLLKQQFEPAGKRRDFFIYKRGKYEAILKSKIIDDDSKMESRTIYEIDLSDHGRFVMNVSFSQFPNDEQYHNDFRYTGYMPLSEIAVTGQIYKKGKNNKETRIRFDDKWKQILHTQSGIWMPHKTSFTQNLFGLIKGVMGNSILFSTPPDQQYYDYGEIFGNFKEQLYTSENFWNYLYKNLNYREGVKMLGRQVDFVSNYLLQLTFDPFLFLHLGFESGAFKPTLLGECIKDRSTLTVVIEHMQNQLRGLNSRFSYPSLIETTLPELSHAYKVFHLNGFSHTPVTGPFMLYKALRELNLLPNGLPYNDQAYPDENEALFYENALSNMTFLLNPANWLRYRWYSSDNQRLPLSHPTSE